MFYFFSNGNREDADKLQERDRRTRHAPVGNQLTLLQVFASKSSQRLHHILCSTSSDPYCSVAEKKKRQAVEREHFISARRLSENFPSSGIYDPTLQRTTSQAPFAYALWILTLDLIRSALFAPSLRLTPIAPFVFVHSFIIQCFCAQRYTGSSVSCFHQIRNVTTTKKIQSFLWFAHLEKVVRAVFSLASTTVTPSIDASLKNPSNLYKMLQLDFT